MSSVASTQKLLWNVHGKSCVTIVLHDNEFDLELTND